MAKKKLPKKTKFEKLVEEARTYTALLKLKNAHRIKIAELCLDACEIKHGGRVELGRATVRKFADAIGVNSQTLNEWCRYYRNIFAKLTEEQQSQYYEVSADTIRGLSTGAFPDTPQREIQKRFKEVYERGPDQKKFDKYCKVLGTLIHHLGSPTRAMLIPEESLDQIAKECRIILKFVASENKFRKRKLERPKPRKLPSSEDVWNEVLQ